MMRTGRTQVKSELAVYITVKNSNECIKNEK